LGTKQGLALLHNFGYTVLRTGQSVDAEDYDGPIPKALRYKKWILTGTVEEPYGHTRGRACGVSISNLFMTRPTEPGRALLTCPQEPYRRRERIGGGMGSTFETFQSESPLHDHVQLSWWPRIRSGHSPHQQSAIT